MWPILFPMISYDPMILIPKQYVARTFVVPTKFSILGKTKFTSKSTSIVILFSFHFAFYHYCIFTFFYWVFPMLQMGLRIWNWKWNCQTIKIKTTSTTTSCSGPPILSSIDVRMWNIRFSKLIRVVYKTVFLSIGV